MKADLPKVLMLGWEFPPLINGGLGVACHDLSAAMSQLADITMIVPKTSPEFKVDHMNLIGMNTLDASHFSDNRLSSDLPFRLESVNADLNPYYTSEAGIDAFRTSGASSQDGLRSFSMNELYGNDMAYKVQQYSDIALSVASKTDFDVIHAHDWMTMMAGVKIKEQTGKPLVMHIHSLEVDRSGPKSQGWVYQVEKKGMQCADLLIPVSNFTADNINRYYYIPKKKMQVVHNGTTSIQPYKSKKPYKEKTVLFVGRLTRQKGPEKFLEIASRVLDKDPDVRFVMAGVGEHFRNMLEQSSYKSIGNRFHLTGFLNLEKLRYLLSFTDVYCMPSVSEPFGLSAVEAAQFGIPCVISKQSGVAEVLNGSLKFDFWDVNKAAGYILNLLHDPVLCKKVATDASVNLNSINWNISAQKIMNAYTEKNFI